MMTWFLLLKMVFLIFQFGNVFLDVREMHWFHGYLKPERVSGSFINPTRVMDESIPAISYWANVFKEFVQFFDQLFARPLLSQRNKGV